jgi:histidinol phosphatase-like enzyme (inositol monophosphatase family)
MTVASLLTSVITVAKQAGDVAAAYFRTALTVEQKADGSPVTVADHEAERTAREWITARFPDDGILGEEYGEHAADAGRRWIIDPIDGTKSFVRGVPLWGTLVAVCDGPSVLAGAAYFPAIQELIAAAPGEGCWWNDNRCSVSAVGSLADATVLTTDERFADQLSRRDGWRALTERALLSRTWGDAYGYLLVATGRAEVMVDPVMNPWDAAPFLPIVEEAGGVLTDWAGQRTVFGGSVVATNSALSRAARAVLGAGAPR